MVGTSGSAQCGRPHLPVNVRYILVGQFSCDAVTSLSFVVFIAFNSALCLDAAAFRDAGALAVAAGPAVLQGVRGVQYPTGL